MRATRMTAIVVGGLVVLCAPRAAIAQGTSSLQAVTHVASLAPGSIHGTVQDERGAPVVGAMVSALGTTTVVAVTDRAGRFDMRQLSPGPYLLRAHLAGFVASRGQVVDVRPSARAASAIALRRSASTANASSTPVLTAGVAGGADPVTVGGAGSETPTGDDDHGEMAWRLRHLRRGILRDTDNIFAATTIDDADAFGEPSAFGHGPLPESNAWASHFASSLFANTPFTGQVNLLTIGSFDAPQQMFTTDNFARSTAYLALGAPIGDHADWTARAALTQGDIASWIVAGEYTTRAPARHRYDLGLSYSTQHYQSGSFSAFQGAADASRDAGAVYGFDTFSITPRVTLTYGGRYAHYDYLEGGGMTSPRVAVTVEPADHFRVSTMLSHRVTAPGAEEFMPRIDNGIWLPPQRTFSSVDAKSSLTAERTDHMEFEVERDIASSATVSLRAFRQNVTDQQVTLFGVELAGAPSAMGHYFVGNIGDVNASGLSAGVRASIARRVHGSVEYSVTRAHNVAAGSDLTYLLLFAPSAVRPDYERIHDVAASLETEVPETSTRVVVLYRVTNASAARDASNAATTSGAPIDARFDVQVRQSLPFMDFSSAKWEMLVAVRNFFRETAPDQSVYDEVLVVHPPKRIVGGLTLKF
jgi:TonB dependent receptor-like, beta-barrel/Carboxypeptidase regulatory-like domain